jgi:hypothetical protein
MPNRVDQLAREDVVYELLNTAVEEWEVCHLIGYYIVTAHGVNVSL